MKTTKTNSASIQPSMMKRPTGAGGLLKIAATLKVQLQRADAGPSWRDRLRAALADPDRNERIIWAVKNARAAGAMDADEASGMIVAAAEVIAEDLYVTDAELRRIGEAIEVASKAHGLKENEHWPEGEGPDDVQELEAQWDRRSHAILAAVLREHGETDAADLLLVEPDKFFDRIKTEWKKSEPTGLDK
jgi:hypothetical protein